MVTHLGFFISHVADVFAVYSLCNFIGDWILVVFVNKALAEGYTASLLATFARGLHDAFSTSSFNFLAELLHCFYFFFGGLLLEGLSRFLSSLNLC